MWIAKEIVLRTYCAILSPHRRRSAADDKQGKAEGFQKERFVGPHKQLSGLGICPRENLFARCAACGIAQWIEDAQRLGRLVIENT